MTALRQEWEVLLLRSFYIFNVFFSNSIDYNPRLDQIALSVLGQPGPDRR